MPQSPKKTSARQWAIGIPAMILVLAGVTWLMLPSFTTPRSYVNENSTISCLRNYCFAQMIYHREARGDVMTYADSLAKLAADRGDDGKPVGKVDAALVAAVGKNGTPRDGYLFKECRAYQSDTGAENVIDWVNDYALSATPAEYGKTGRRTFIINLNGTVWGQDLGRSELLEHYPTAPASGGWKIAN